MDIAIARQITAHAALHSKKEVLNACEVLEASKDWKDYTRAAEIRRAIAREPEEPTRWIYLLIALIFLAGAAALWMVAANASITGTCAQVLDGAVEW